MPLKRFGHTIRVLRRLTYLAGSDGWLRRAEVLDLNRQINN